ncbi:Pollen receptor-like kinase 3 [Linum perenne]
MALELDSLFLRQLTIFLLFLIASSAADISDSDALLLLKKSFNNDAALISWDPASSSPCNTTLPWHGVFCSKDKVTGLRLEDLGLSGKIDVDALLHISSLRTLSFANNSFSGDIPQLNRLSYLRTVYLARNNFSGQISPGFFLKMVALKKLWLADNEFSGLIPTSLAAVSNLVELHLENNRFSGQIPNLELHKLQQFDVSNNRLVGEIPEGLAKFKSTAFGGNPNLCGEVIGKECALPENKAAGAATASEGIQHNPNATAVGIDRSNFKKTTAGIIALSVLVLITVIVLVIKLRCKEDDDDDGFGTLINQPQPMSGNHDRPPEVQVSIPPATTTRLPSAAGVDSGMVARGRASNVAQGKAMVGEFVMMNEDKGVFGLADLMKSAAEAMGSGGLGSSYKAVLAGGTAVVVKRIREMNAMGKDGFESEIRMLGKLRHPNVLTPLAFHYRKDEKLLIYEFVPTGSLLFLIHGERVPGHPGLNWAARLRILKGVARGLSYIHSQQGGSNLPHGNLKSSNILVGPDNEPRVSEYGFSSLVNSSVITTALFAYKTPEAASGHVSPKSDVYCLGILILETLTGKLPCQYAISGAAGTDLVQWIGSAISEGREAECLDPEIAVSTNSVGQMVSLMQVGFLCAHSLPEQRLDLREAVRRIDETQLDDSSTYTSSSFTRTEPISYENRSQKVDDEHQLP